jgi:hypothetical protein
MATRAPSAELGVGIGLAGTAAVGTSGVSSSSSFEHDVKIARPASIHKNKYFFFIA